MFYWVLKITMACNMSCGYPPTPTVCKTNCGTAPSYYENTWDSLAAQDRGDPAHRVVFATAQACQIAKAKWLLKTPEGFTTVKVLTCEQRALQQ